MTNSIISSGKIDKPLQRDMGDSFQEKYKDSGERAKSDKDLEE